MNFSFFNVEGIYGYTSDFVYMCSATSYPFVFPYRIKHLPLNVLKFCVTALRNQNKKISFIQVDEDGALARYSEFVKSWHIINIIVQTTGGYSYSLNDKSEIPNKTLGNNKRALLLNSSHMK